ncbi:uncharacterized protein Dmul_27870 [Desulfococcus multivorans]|jgi:hypothetical protein|nr:uncharacterized protein Dmul_27870 [Desulfococcus multivorans]
MINAELSFHCQCKNPVLRCFTGIIAFPGMNMCDVALYISDWHETHASVGRFQPTNETGPVIKAVEKEEV